MSSPSTMQMVLIGCVGYLLGAALEITYRKIRRYLKHRQRSALTMKCPMCHHVRSVKIARPSYSRLRSIHDN